MRRVYLAFTDPDNWVEFNEGLKICFAILGILAIGVASAFPPLIREPLARLKRFCFG